MDALQRFTSTLPQLLLAAASAALLGLAELDRSHFERLMQEDGWAEWATFLLFALASGLAITDLSTRPRRERFILLGLALFCLFVAGEEISWGQRLLGFRPPHLFLEYNYQQESNLHNLLKDIFDTRWMVFSVAVLYGVVAPYVVHVAHLPRVLGPPLALLPWFALVAWLEFSYPYELVGELAELLLGLLFLLDVFERTHSREAGSGAQTQLIATAIAAGALASALLLGGLNDLARMAQSPELVVHTRMELESLAARMRDGTTLRSKLFHRRGVHKRLYTAARAGYLKLDPDEYYLDAWNSPYWFAFERTSADKGRILIYSLGANRKRDLVFEGDYAPLRAGGDDVSLALEIATPAQAAIAD